MRAYRHSSHGSYGSSGGSYGGSSGGSSGGSYSTSSYGSYGSSGGGSSGGSAGGSYGGYSAPAYSSGMPIESYRVIDETPSMTGGEIIGVPKPTDSTQLETVPADAALLVVEVPAGAKIFVNGSETKSTGGVRRFMSRGLQAGKQYEFAVKMTVDRDGTPAEETKMVSLTAGERSTVSFDSAAKTSLTLRVPADAKVWLAGNATAASGTVRQFETAGLTAGQSWKNYEIRVTAVVDGREETISKVIDLAAGDRIELALDPAQRVASADATASLR
jgi:uncharacterized protein (TIGR03000 family)